MRRCFPFVRVDSLSNSDPEFAAKLSRVCEGKHTSTDIKGRSFGRYWFFCSARKNVVVDTLPITLLKRKI